MATVRELVVALGLDFDATGFAKADAAVRALRTGFLGVGSIITGAAAALTAVTVATANTAADVNNFSKTIGVSTDAVQKLGFAAQMSGSNADTLRSGLTFLARQAQAAASGSGDAAESFARFGVRLRDGEGQLKTADRLLLDVANGMRDVTNPTERAAMAAQLLGRSAGPELVNLLSQGEGGIAELGDELDALGGLMDGDFIDAAAELNDTLDRMQVIVKSVGINVARAFLPFVQDVTKGIVSWWKANRQLVSSGIDFFVRRMASAFSGIAGVLRVAVGAFTAFAEQTTPVGRVLMVLAGAALTMALAFASPIVAVVALSALILALADDVNEFVTGGKSVLGDFVDWMITWGTDTGGVFGGLIADVGKFLKDFRGAGWKPVIDEVNAHFKILADTLTTIWTVMQKVAAGSRLFVGAITGNNGTDQGSFQNDVRTLGGGALLDAGARIDRGINSALGIGGGGTTNVGGNTTMNVEVNVTAPTGDGPDIARVVKQVIIEERDEWVTALHAATVPGK